MKLVGKLKLKEFSNAHHGAKKPLDRWCSVVEHADWHKFADVKKTFGNADWYGKDNKGYVIFNIGGNKYRVIAAINFKGLIVVVKVILTHKEYDKDKWKEAL